MADVIVGASPFVSEVVRIERRAAGSIVDAAALVPGVRGPKSNFLDCAARAEAQVVGLRSAVGLILQNVSRALAQRPHAARGQRRIECSRQGRVYVHASQRVQRAPERIANVKAKVLVDLVLDTDRTAHLPIWLKGCGRLSACLWLREC